MLKNLKGKSRDRFSSFCRTALGGVLLFFGSFGAAGATFAAGSAAPMAASAPAITVQPTNQLAYIGNSATLSVTATGTAPLSYQWFFNGTAVGGASASSYTITGLTTNAAGGYKVAVTNPYGSVTSSVATLAVYPPGLYVSNGILMRAGRPFRGIGVNFVDCFWRTIQNGTRGFTNTSYQAGFSFLASKKISFVRFAACGFWPSDYALYLTNQAQYFAQLDAVVQCAASNGIGLIPDLNQYFACVPDLVTNSCNQWGNTNSRTIAFMRTYATNLISRYTNSPTIWGWEFGNEYNNNIDLMEQATNYGFPKTNVAYGTPAFRTTDDLPYTTNLLVAFSEFSKVVRTLDPTRLICNGNAFCDDNQWHRYHGSWTTDADVDYSNILSAFNLSFNSTYIHLYPNEVPGAQFSNRKVTRGQYIHATQVYSSLMKRPLYIGEFGASSLENYGTNNPDLDRADFTELLDGIVTNQVPLSAMWVYDYKGQSNTMNVSSNNARSYMLDLVAVANNKVRTTMGLQPAQYVLNVTQGTNGLILPGLVVVDQGATQTFTITPTNANYSVISVTVDGVNQGPITSYSFNNVSAAHTITALFLQVPMVSVPLSATAITNGQMLSSSILSGTFTNAAAVLVPGTLAFALPTLVPPVGTTNVAVVFTPDDGTNYSTVTNVVTVTINPAAAPNPPGLTVLSAFGAPNPASVTTYAYGALINAYVPSPVVSGNTQYVATGWTGSGSLTGGTGTNTSFYITNNTTLNWLWITNIWVSLNTLGK